MYEHRLARQRVIRLREVRMRVGLGANTVYRYLAEGKFPGPVSIGGACEAWVESDIDAWIAARIDAADAAS